MGFIYAAEKEIWAACSTGGVYCLKLNSSSSTFSNFDSCHCFEFISGVATAMCIVDDTVWMGDTMGKIHVIR